MSAHENDLHTISTDRLQAELKRREEEEQKRERLQRVGQFYYVMRHLSVLLPLIPHARTSCSDENRANAYTNETGVYRCPRCALLDLKNFQGVAVEAGEPSDADPGVVVDLEVLVRRTDGR